eukprot:gene22964-27944_t
MDLENDDESIFGDSDHTLHPGLIGPDLHLMCPFPVENSHSSSSNLNTNISRNGPNITYTAATQDASILPPELQKTWENIQEAEEAVHKYAKLHQFEVIRRSTKTFRQLPGTSSGDGHQEKPLAGQIRLVFLVCSRYGKASTCYGKKHQEAMAAQQNGQKEKVIHTKKCDCPCKIVLIRDSDVSNWYIKPDSVDLTHNHMLRLKGDPPSNLSVHKKRVFREMLGEYESALVEVIQRDAKVFAEFKEYHRRLMLFSHANGSRKKDESEDDESHSSA